MNIFRKIWMHPITDIVIVTGLIILVLVLGFSKAFAAEDQMERQPMVDIIKVSEKAGCVSTSVRTWQFDYSDRYALMTCRTKSRFPVYAENYTSVSDQSRDIRWKERSARGAEFWIARCRGYNVGVDIERSDKSGYRFAKNYSKHHRGCRPQHIDGRKDS